MLTTKTSVQVKLKVRYPAKQDIVLLYTSSTFSHNFLSIRHGNKQKDTKGRLQIQSKCLTVNNYSLT